MNDEAAFLDALRADPADSTRLLVYADWLEERGDPRAEYIRLTHNPLGHEARIEALRRQFDPAWVVLIEGRGEPLEVLEVRADLLRVEQHWHTEQEQYRIQYESDTEARLPDRQTTFEHLLVGGIVLAVGFGLCLGGMIWERKLENWVSGLFTFGSFWIVVGVYMLYSRLVAFLRYQRAWRAYQERRGHVAARAPSQPPG